MSYVIRCIGLADGTPGPAGHWLESYDTDTGFSDWTLDESKAMRFETLPDAVNLYGSILPSQPVRPWDGKPNRPLTAFAVEIEPAPESRGGNG